MRFEIHGKMKSLIAGTLCSLALGLWACSDEVETPVAAPNLSELFENIDDADIDLESHAIVLPEGTDSFTVDNIAALGGKKCYLALDDDPVDPEIDWDNPVSTGTTLAIGEEGLRLVVLDESNRVVDVWTISLPEGESSSSVAKRRRVPRARSPRKVRLLLLQHRVARLLRVRRRMHLRPVRFPNPVLPQNHRAVKNPNPRAANVRNRNCLAPTLAPATISGQPRAMRWRQRRPLRP